MSPTAQLADKVSGLLGSRFSRRGFFARSAVVGSAIAANPLTYALTPTDAYAAVCSCNGSNCECGSMCCDGYTEFCCTISGKNQCPPGALLGGWWKVDGSGFCSGPRYYMDCNAPCNGCGCGGSGICSGSAGCANTTCGCALGDCDNRKAGCVNFRYGQCNQQVSCIGPIICRVVTCIAPWEIDGTCTTTARYDANTATHDRPCLHKVVGDLNSAVETTLNGAPAIRVTGWAIDFDTNSSIDVHVYVDGNYATKATASVPRPDVAIANPGQGPNHGFDVTIPASSGVHNVCVYGINSGPVGNGNPAVGCATVKVGSPFGSLDGFATGPSQVTVRGWAADPDTSGPVNVHVYVDGNWAGQGVADQSRPDVGQAFPALGPNHGYSVTVPLAVGSHNVCVYAINVGNGAVNTQLGCTTVVGGNPFGSLDEAAATAGGVAVRGWAVDPDQLTSPIDVQLRLDGNPVTTVTAAQSRPDVGDAYPSAGSAHGFSQTIPAAAGVHTISAVALNVGPGVNQVLASRTVEVRSGSPFGNLEHTWTGPGTIRVQGWVLDPDDTGPVQVQVEVDGVVVTTATADVPRPDVAAVYPGYGPVHGFVIDVPAGNGLRLVRVTALNIGPGTPVVLGVRQLQVGGNPLGNFEDVVVAYGRVAVAGWAIDPDTAGPTDVHVYIDGTLAVVGTANQSRPDVAAAFPLYGPNHGFSVSTPITRGRHEVCVFAINQGPGTDNPLLACRTVTA
jgi:hypothetical protein